MMYHSLPIFRQYGVLARLPAFAAICLLGLTSGSFAEPEVRHSVVYHKVGEFAGWPANGGLWMWDDEVLVGFERWTYDPDPSGRHHAVSPTFGTYFSRSKDGGLTWQGEGRAPTVSSNPDLDFLGEGFALRLWRRTFLKSSNRAGDWHGPFDLPGFEGYEAYARTNYIVTGRDSVLLFLSTQPQDGSPSRSFLARFHGNAMKFEFVSWIGCDYLDRSRVTPEPNTYTHATMPSGLWIRDGHYLCAVRQRVGSDRWADLYETSDDGLTWNFRSTIERGSDNPISLVSFGGDVVAAIYGWRSRPYGLRAKVSHDAGRTWSDQIVLREDAINDDIGYTRAAVRSDGTVVIVYYYATHEHPEQHIAVTFWRPPELASMSDAAFLAVAFGSADQQTHNHPDAWLADDGRLSIGFMAARPYVHYQVQASSDLLHWEDLTPFSSPAEAGFVTVKDPFPGFQRFMRVQAKPSLDQAIRFGGNTILAEWSFDGVSLGKTNGIEAQFVFPRLQVSALHESGGTNHIGVVDRSFGRIMVSGSDPFKAPALEVGMSTTTDISPSGYSLNFTVEPASGFELNLAGLSFDLGYDTDYGTTLPNYHAPQAQLYVSQDFVDWHAVGDPVTPDIGGDAAKFSTGTGSGGAYFVDSAITINLAGTAGGTVGVDSRQFFRIVLSELHSSNVDRRRVILDNITGTAKPLP